MVKEFTVKGFVMDDERLKKGGTVLTEKYFEEQLQRVREIRLSERTFYQKITDIYATAIDYDRRATATQRFFATMQNKLHWVIHGHTAAEVIVDRTNAEKQHMGLTTWKDAPRSICAPAHSVVKTPFNEDSLESHRPAVSLRLSVFA